MDKTIIGSSLVIEGDVESENALEVHGTIKGKRVSARNVKVYASGTVEAEVDGELVRVEGKVVGPISATRVEISEDGHMEGDIRAPRVLIADGAHFRGNVDMS